MYMFIDCACDFYFNKLNYMYCTKSVVRTCTGKGKLIYGVVAKFFKGAFRIYLNIQLKCSKLVRNIMD